MGRREPAPCPGPGRRAKPENKGARPGLRWAGAGRPHARRSGRPAQARGMRGRLQPAGRWGGDSRPLPVRVIQAKLENHVARPGLRWAGAVRPHARRLGRPALARGMRGRFQPAGRWGGDSRPLPGGGSNAKLENHVARPGLRWAGAVRPHARRLGRPALARESRGRLQPAVRWGGDSRPS